MSLRDLLALYATIGVACAVAVMRRAEGPRAAALASALVTVPLWPVWAPFALGRTRARRGPEGQGSVARIERALEEAVQAVAGTNMADVFSRQAAARIMAQVERVAVRLDELAGLAAQSGLDVAASRERLRALEERRAPERAVATARMQLESLLRLEQLKASDLCALDELADLLEALRTQLLLARYEGSSAEGVGAIVSEVWARLEGLGEAFDGAQESPVR
jgi:hypothetical protein